MGLDKVTRVLIRNYKTQSQKIIIFLRNIEVGNHGDLHSLLRMDPSRSILDNLLPASMWHNPHHRTHIVPSYKGSSHHRIILAVPIETDWPCGTPYWNPKTLTYFHSGVEPFIARSKIRTREQFTHIGRNSYTVAVILHSYDLDLMLHQDFRC